MGEKRGEEKAENALPKDLKLTCSTLRKGGRLLEEKKRRGTYEGKGRLRKGRGSFYVRKEVCRECAPGENRKEGGKKPGLAGKRI